ncbi:hypothetical protein GALMADRAFT_94674 [Galerina marginata CBS 339.88]|uniref:MYND-type domain-containing protein n=1 Tax=Galerina marginata (strain CBS 339.88) TaxID=685588 RepID=A0A067TE10_GALM3|nr:hypothetical protein GALMADRAFT_94674 [Galerina marginata CBS 339.88]
MQKNSGRMPNILASKGQACHYCFKETSVELPLKRCSRCLHVCYCGPACQNADWKEHKGLCKAFKAFEADHCHDVLAQYMFLDEDEESGVVTKVDQLNNCLDRVVTKTMHGLEMILRRPLRVDERNIVGWEPRCLACGRSDSVFQIESSLRQRAPQSSGLRRCPDCLSSFYCSEEHWNAVKGKHQHGPCKDGRDNLSHCEMNKFILEDIRFAEAVVVASKSPTEFEWAPERTLPAWSSLRGVEWSDFAPALAESFHHLPADERALLPRLRAASESLSMPMTILWGLELLNSNDTWTKADTLNIHVIGAADQELRKGRIFEEILHRMPLIRTLKMTFCGPELQGMTGPFPSQKDMPTCPQCLRDRRKIVYAYQPKTYHDYITSQGTKYTKPDLAIAFNSGCSQEEVQSWQRTLLALAQQGVPAVFTAFNQEEAVAEAELLRKAGATLHSELGPRRNPWGSLLSKTEPNKVTGFYSLNGWLAGGFR